MGPTLADVRTWPATCSVPDAALVLGISRSHAFEMIHGGVFPVRTLKVSGRIRVITAELLRIVDVTEETRVLPDPRVAALAEELSAASQRLELIARSLAEILESPQFRLAS